MWILSFIYVMSILYGLIILKMVVGDHDVVLSRDIILSLSPYSICLDCVSLAYWVGAFTFFALFLYMWNTIELLKTETIIKRLANRITKDRILNPKEDSIQPIMDIIHGSIMRYDIAASKAGLESVTKKVIEIIDLDCEEDISRCYCDHFEQACKLAASKTDETLIGYVISNLGDFSGNIMEKRFGVAVERTLESLNNIKKITAEKGLENAGEQAENLLRQLRDRRIKLLDEKDNVNQEKRKTFVQQDIRYIGPNAVNAANNSGNISLWELQSLYEAGKRAVENEFEDDVFTALDFFMRAGHAAVCNGFLDSAIYVAKELIYFGRFVIEKENKKTTIYMIKILAEIGTIAAGKGRELEPVTKETAKSLGHIGTIVVEKKGEKPEDIINKQLLPCLNSIRKSADEHNLEGAIRQVNRSFIEIGVFATESGLSNAAQEAANFLAKAETCITVNDITSIAHGSRIIELQECSGHLEEFKKIYTQQLNILEDQQDGIEYYD